ncbi:MAG TPA: hypothetical protein VJM50_09235 [Pyrinomonadaceae bacterium]|nr:hypothetical protein [Pyrinomonadaceae bacterium]
MRRVFYVTLLLICSVCAAAQAPQTAELDLKDISGRSVYPLPVGNSGLGIVAKAISLMVSES